MAYIKNTWVDREGVTRYFETVDEDGALILTPDYAQVTEIGTPVNADNMNHIEEGIASGSFTKFDLNATYFENDLVTVIEDGTPVIYKSLTNDNTGNSLTNSSSWEKISLGGGGGGLEIGDIGIAPLGIDETKGKRRYLNGSIIIQDQYKVFSEKVKLAVQTYAGLGCTEEEWQTISNLSVGGQCGKFVVDDTAGTIRLPKIIMPIQGLTDLTKLGEIVEAGLPNIEGSLKANYKWDNYGSTGAFSHTIYNINAPTGAEVHSGGVTYTLDASQSNPIYGNSDTVQQEQIQYPYFIQVATGSETEENITNEIELNNPFSLLDYKFSEYELNNLSWLRSNGQWNSKAVYPAVYDLLLKIYNGSETKAGVSVKLHTEDYTDEDFVINQDDETFRLQLKVKLASGRAVVGNGMSLGLTNGTDNFGLSTKGTGGQGYVTAYGSLYGVDNGTGSPTDYVSTTQATGVTTDPTKSGMELSDSDLYLYFYVGETVQNANLVNVGRIEEKLSGCITRNDCTAYIVETYNDGTSWYRIYSDGWCEQGGRTGSAGSATITFLKPFLNTDYTVVAVQATTSIRLFTLRGQTTTGFSYTIVNSNGAETNNGYSYSNWQASGYIA